MMGGENLAKLAQLLRLAAETTRMFAKLSPGLDGQGSRVAEISDVILAASEELQEIGHGMVRKEA